MKFDEANAKMVFCDEDAMKAFNCEYFHNICIKCKNKPKCNRKEPLIRKCDFHEEASE